MSVCTGIELVESLPHSGDLIRVTIDGDTEALWFYNYGDALKYLDQDVIVEYRQDIYKGELRQFIATFVIPTVVNTLTKEDNIKLFCDTVDNFSNLSFNEIEVGETRQGCIVYCVSCTFKSSSAAVWQELVIRDKSMHVAKLRLFDYSNKAANFTGSYVMTELTRSKYGFQSELIVPVNGECPPNPEVDIAVSFIKSYFASDTGAMYFLTKYNLINKMKENIDFEPGYGLVRLAMELSIVDSMRNITNDVDLESMGHALLASRGYLVRESELSEQVNNIILASKVSWKDKALVLKLLDFPTDGEEFPERKVMNSIKETVGTILIVRKGILD